MLWPAGRGAPARLQLRDPQAIARLPIGMHAATVHLEPLPCAPGEPTSGPGAGQPQKTSGHSLLLSRAPSHAPPTCPVDAARPVPWRPDPAATDLRPQQSSREAWDEQGSTPDTRALGTRPHRGRERGEDPEDLAAGDSVRRGARLGLGGVYSPWKGRAGEAGPLRLH